MKTDNGFVYAIADESANVKFGVTVGSGGPAARLRTLQTGNAQRLSFVGKFEHDEPHIFESHLHNALAPFRLQGEWFAPSIHTTILCAYFELDFIAGACLYASWLLESRRRGGCETNSWCTYHGSVAMQECASFFDRSA